VLNPSVDQRRVEAVKFASCLPDGELVRMLAVRDVDPVGISTVAHEPIVVAE
jgi:hypothetical protein